MIKGLGIAFICLSLLTTHGQAHASSRANLCSASLTAQWRNVVIAHAIDPSTQIPVVDLSVPSKKRAQTGYADALRRLAAAYPSFKEAPQSGILLGCCSIPVFGSIAFDDLSKMSAERFTRVCDIADHFASTFVGLRIEDREQYERDANVVSGFVISWPPVQRIRN